MERKLRIDAQSLGITGWTLRLTGAAQPREVCHVGAVITDLLSLRDPGRRSGNLATPLKFNSGGVQISLKPPKTNHSSPLTAVPSSAECLATHTARIARMAGALCNTKVVHFRVKAPKIPATKTQVRKNSSI